MYEEHSLRAKSGNEIAASFKTPKGLLQGCMTLLTLFNIFWNSSEAMERQIQGNAYPE